MMNRFKYAVYADRPPYLGYGMRLYMFQSNQADPDNHEIICGFKTKKMPRHGCHNEHDTPFYHRGEEASQFLQAMLDCAWDLGLRPTNKNPNKDGEISALKYHLEDMRRLVFGDGQKIETKIDIPRFKE